MSDTEVKLLVGLAAVVGIFLGGIFKFFYDYILKKEDFKNIYYKMILKKRIDAYEKVYGVVENLCLADVGEQGDAEVFLAFCSVENYNELKELRRVALMSYLFCGSETRNKIRELEHMFNDFIISDDHEQGDLRRIGVDNYNRIREARIGLVASVFKDYKNLHDIKDYFENIKIK
jgi:hypothetical protein